VAAFIGVSIDRPVSCPPPARPAVETAINTRVVSEAREFVSVENEREAM
jgi:hypothetical protein